MEKRTSGLILGGIGALAALGAFVYMRGARYDFKDRVVVITGGSRGLGLVLARGFAERGAKIAICARKPDELDRARAELESMGAKVYAAPCDVRRAADVRSYVAAVRNEFGPVDVLVNCAGVIQVGPLETQTREDFEELMNVHFWGPYNTMREVVLAMRERGGRIVNISSIGGKLAVPHLSAYCASKFALAGLSNAFGAELAKDNIRVTTVFPGLMRTGSHLNARFKGQNEKEFALFSLADATPLTTVSAEHAAETIIEAAGRGQAELVISVQAKAAAHLQHFAPELVSALMGITNRLLPGPGGIGTASASGVESSTAISPSIATALIDQAAFDNNEVEANAEAPVE